MARNSVWLAAVLLAGPAWGACPAPPPPKRAILLNLVPGACLSGQVSKGDPAPCVVVAPGDGGYAVLKDRSPEKPFEYLVVPTAPVCGIEDPVLQAGHGPGYFEAAWEARALLRARFDGDLPEDRVGLAVNAHTVRSQDQLHIHVGCLKAAVRDALRRHPPGPAWARLPEPLNGHAFSARFVSGAAWPGVNPAAELRALVGSAERMQGTGLVVAGAPEGGFYLLESDAPSEAAGADRGTGFGEGLLDHSCGG